MLSSKNEKIVDEDVFYIFVHLHQLDKPSYYIVPSKVVADTISKEHKDWLNSPSKNGELHKDSNIRTIRFDDDTYLEKWDYLD